VTGHLNVRVPVVRAVRFVLAHVPDLVVAGSKPRRELARHGDALRALLRPRLRGFDAAVTYAPHQILIGNQVPEALHELPRPWHDHPLAGARTEGPAGMIVDQDTFYAWLARADTANLVQVSEEYAPRIAARLDGGRLMVRASTAIERAREEGAEPFYYRDGGTGLATRLAGVVLSAHEEDESLQPAVLLENLAAKVTGALALRRLLDEVAPHEPVDFLVGSGEEAVGDRYQRGGGNLAKAIGELAGAATSGGADVKAWCAGPVHALIMAAALVAAGVHRRAVVIGGGSLAKLGMKFRGHLAAGYPILEDVLAGVAIDVVADDGRSPAIRLDAVAVHKVADGGAAHQLYGALAQAPLRALGFRLTDVDRFAVELHNPDITEPAGSGDVPANSYKMLAALAARAGEITREQMAAFVRTHGLPGFSPTQGHIPSAIPYLPHAIRGLTEGTMTRVQFIAKGSLFLGRMTGMADGASILLERNSALAAAG
jgi:glycine/sarcosine/betaine reductase complex component C subunit beta